MKNNYINFVFLIFINFFISNQSMDQSMDQSTNRLYDSSRFSYNYFQTSYKQRYANFPSSYVEKEKSENNSEKELFDNNFDNNKDNPYAYGLYLDEQFEFIFDNTLYPKSKLRRAILRFVHACAIPAKSHLRLVLNSLFAGGIFGTAVYFYDKEFNKKVLFGGAIGASTIGVLSYLAKKSIDKSQEITQQSYKFFEWIENNHKEGDINTRNEITQLANTCLNKRKANLEIDLKKNQKNYRDDLHHNLNELFTVYLRENSELKSNQKSIINYIADCIDYKVRNIYSC